VTIREQIVVEIMALLLASPPGSVTIKRSHTFAITLAANKSIVVVPFKDETQPVGGRSNAVLQYRELIVLAECRAKGTTTTRPDEEVDSLLVYVVKTLCGRGDASALYMQIEEGATTFDVEQADNSLCKATVEIRVRYTHRTNDPELRA
jgi:homoserine acetyltransferase